MIEVQSASSFHKLVHSQVITMKTLKEDAHIRGVCVYDMHSCQHGLKKMRDVLHISLAFTLHYHINILRNPNEVDVHWSRNAKPKYTYF